MVSLFTRRLVIAMGLFSQFFNLFGSAKANERRFADVQAFREYVMQTLRRKPDIASVEPDTEDPTVIHAKFGEIEWTLDVTNIYGRLSASPDADIDDTIQRFLSLSDPMESRQVADQNVVVVIRSRDYVDYFSQKGLKLRHEPLAGDLAAVYMADSPNAMSPLVEEDMADKSLEQLRTIALNNLQEWLPKIVSDESLEICTLFYVEDNTFLSTSLVLLDDFWKSIERKFPGDVLIALPRTDQLFVLDPSNPQAPEMARRLIEATFKDGFNLLSEKIYERRSGRLAVFAGN